MSNLKNNLSPMAATGGRTNDKNRSFGSFVNSILHNTGMIGNSYKKSRYNNKNSKSVLLSKDAS